MHALGGQAAAQTGKIVDRTADAVEPVDQNFVDEPGFRISQQLLQGRAVDILAGKAFIGVDLAALEFARGQCVAAELRLLFDRNAVRPFNRLAGVDGNYAFSSFPVSCARS